MMWTGREEPLFDQRVLGELVRYIWQQDGEQHRIRCEWQFGQEPWDKETCEAQGAARHLVIDNATRKMEEIIRKKK